MTHPAGRGRARRDGNRRRGDPAAHTWRDEQARRAQSGNSLWTQCGTKADPLLNSVFGNDYGFGALRCSVDNLNGDHVEWIGSASGTHHVFCYYCAVQPPPSAGTIIVHRQADDRRRPGHLDVAKTLSGTLAGLQDAVRITVTCDDGTAATLSVPARATGTTHLAPSVVIRDATTCTVKETATGENAHASLTWTTVSVNGAEAPVASSATVPVSFGRSSSADVTDLYGALPPTGLPSSTGAVALGGLLLLGIGTVIYVAAAPR